MNKQLNLQSLWTGQPHTQTDSGSMEATTMGWGWEEDCKCKELPEECWEVILTFLHQRHFHSLSLVSKLFLSLTNLLLRSLSLSPMALPHLPSLLLRFPHLSSLRLPHHHLLLLPNLRTLSLSSLSDHHDLAHSFPNLHHLDLSYPTSHRPITDHGIVRLSRTLPLLRRIDLSGNPCLTDLSLLALSESLPRLNRIDLRHCDLVTHKGIDLCFRRFRELGSISASGIGVRSVDPSFLESFSFAGGLRELTLSDSVVSEDLVGSIVAAGLPLKKLDLLDCLKLTYGSIRKLLCKYRFLEHLGLEGFSVLTDQMVIELCECEFLSKLTSVNLNSCSKLTLLCLARLAGSCPMLEDIRMEKTGFGKEDKEHAGELELSVVNCRVRSLNLAFNRKLSDGCINKIISICPKVEVMDLSHCPGASPRGIGEILKSLKELWHLEMSQCGGIEGVGSEIRDCKLEVLVARRSGINDEALAMIGNKCPRLYRLELESCMNVTARGVKEVVNRCRVLKEVNIMSCYNVSADVVAWMVFSSSSLRKIVPPCGLPTIDETDFYLRHGCLVYNT